MEKIKSDYFGGISILRVLLTFEVILVHFWTNSEDYFILKPFNFLRKCDVPTFMLLSFFLTEKHICNPTWKKGINRIKRLGIPFVVWGGFNWLFLMLVEEVFKLELIDGLSALFWQLITGHAYHVNAPMWYIVSLMYLTVIYMVVFKICNKKAGLIIINGLLVLSLIFQYSGLNYRLFNGLVFELKYPLGRFVEMIPFAACGIDLAHFKYFDNLSNYRILSIVVSVFLLIILSVMNMANIIPTPENFSYGGIFLILMAILLLTVAMLFSFEKFPEKTRKYFGKICSHTLGIYCTHYLVGNTLFMLLSKKSEIVTGGFYWSIIIYLICWILCEFLAKIHVSLGKLVD